MSDTLDRDRVGVYAVSVWISDRSEAVTRMDGAAQVFERVRARALNAGTRCDSSTSGSPLRPVKPSTVVAAEAELGFALHPFVKRLYLEIGNGGFGPGYGLIGLRKPSRPDDPSLVDMYRQVRDSSWRQEDPAWLDVPEWPEGLLPLFDWGCAIWSCIDARAPEGIIVTHDDVSGATVTRFTIESWLREWVAGTNLWHEIYEEGEDVPFGDPFTKTVRMVKGPGRAKGRPYA